MKIVVPSLSIRPAQINSYCQNDNRRSSTGVVLIEAALVMPLLLILLMAIVDLGEGLSQYMKLNQVAHEGVRIAAARLNLEEGLFENLSMTGETTLDHAIVQAKIQRLLDCQSWRLRDFSISSELNLSGSADTVSIELHGQYRGMFLPYVEIPVRIRSEGAYLFERSAGGLS